MQEFIVNDYITLKLEYNKTNIYLNNEYFEQCKLLLFNIPIEEDSPFDEIESIDEAAEKLDHSMERGTKNVKKISPETEFWGHCSNLQVWVEMNYDTRFLHRNLAFPLLKRLSELGDFAAKKAFKDEIAKRFSSWNPSVINFLQEEKYLDYLNINEMETLFQDFKYNLEKIKDLKTKIKIFELFIKLGIGQSNQTLNRFINQNFMNCKNPLDLAYLMSKQYYKKISNSNPLLFIKNLENAKTFYTNIIYILRQDCIKIDGEYIHISDLLYYFFSDLKNISEFTYKKIITYVIKKSDPKGLINILYFIETEDLIEIITRKSVFSKMIQIIKVLIVDNNIELLETQRYWNKKREKFKYILSETGKLNSRNFKELLINKLKSEDVKDFFAIIILNWLNYLTDEEIENILNCNEVSFLNRVIDLIKMSTGNYFDNFENIYKITYSFQYLLLILNRIHELSNKIYWERIFKVLKKEKNGIIEINNQIVEQINETHIKNIAKNLNKKIKK